MDPKVEGPGLNAPAIKQAILVDLNQEAARMCLQLRDIPELNQGEWLRAEAMRVVMSYDNGQGRSLDRSTLLFYLGMLVGQGLAGQ